MLGWLKRWLIRKVVKRVMLDLLKLKFLEGHRTQIAAVIMAVLTLLLNLGIITIEQYNLITGFLLSIGLITASIHKPKP